MDGWHLGELLPIFGGFAILVGGMFYALFKKD